MSKIAIIGSGLIGSSWGIVFARKGHEVRIFDQNENAFSASKKYIKAELKTQAANDDELHAWLGAIRHTTELSTAIEDACYVQEAAFEREDVKTAIFSALDELVEDNVILASSASGIPCSAFTEHLIHRTQCVIAHPVNPPHLIPLVEVVPAPWTSNATVRRTMALMQQVGQSPVQVKKEIEGFILNRLQGALLNEAWWLFEEGYASIDEIDRTVRDGLSLRWSFMGPFQTIDLNAPDGIGDYARRLAPLYFSIASSRANPTPWSSNAIEAASKEMKALRQRLENKDLQAWRNEMLRSFMTWRLTNNITPDSRRNDI